MGIYDELDLRLHGHIDHLLQHGWQPADLAHLVRREFTQRHQRLVVGLLARHARRHDAPNRAPQEWLDQLEELGAFDPRQSAVVGGHGIVTERWARAEKLDAPEALQMAGATGAILALSRDIPVLMPPPAQWGASNRGHHERSSRVDEVPHKTLHTIRALLAKAESTEFEAEAEAFTAKAQEMMTRHSIDVAMLAAHTAGARPGSGVIGRRVHVDNPYADEKALFVSMIAEVNGVASVWSSGPGFCTLMGFPVDVHLTEVLFTSLLVQATHASAVATANRRDLRTASFRRAFLVSFAERIAERLEAARSSVHSAAEADYGSDLAPVLASRAAAVHAAVAQAFPSTTSMRSKRYDAEGWYAGRAAANHAHIGAGAAIER